MNFIESKSSVFLIVITFIVIGVFMRKNETGKIILLNGTSSSGKSAILKELKKINNNLQIIKIDDWFPKELHKKAIELGWKEESNMDQWLYLHNYMTNKTGKYYFDIELRENLFNNISEFYQKVKALSLNGNNVIIDTVLETDKDYKNFYHSFKDNKVIKILIYCPLNILLQRVEDRNKSGNPAEKRTAFQSFEQFFAMYKIQENSKEKIIDIVKASVLKKSLEDAIQHLIKNNIPESYYPKLEQFKKKFIERFALNNTEQISLVATHEYHLILNSGLNSPDELAQIISDFIEKDINK